MKIALINGVLWINQRECEEWVIYWIEVGGRGKGKGERGKGIMLLRGGWGNDDNVWPCGS